MTDRELLELAAKAAGYKADFTQPYEIEIDSTWIEWDPLTDDGDALRLAVKLSLHVRVMRRAIMVEKRELGDETFEPIRNDPYAATRRAIVRAAAEIGKTL